MLIKKEDMLRQKRKFPAIATILRGSSAIATFLDVVAKTLTNNLSRNLDSGALPTRMKIMSHLHSTQKRRIRQGLVLLGQAGQGRPARQARG